MVRDEETRWPGGFGGRKRSHRSFGAQYPSGDCPLMVKHSKVCRADERRFQKSASYLQLEESAWGYVSHD